MGVLNIEGYYDHLMRMLDKATEENFIFIEHRQTLLVCEDPLVLLDAMERYQYPDEAVKRWMRQV